MANKPDASSQDAHAELELRRSGFLGGELIFLAEGRGRFFPGPAQIESAGPSVIAEVMELIEAIGTSEDEAERLQGELALAIHLLSLNYELGPDDYRRLLGGAAGASQLARIQASIRLLAVRLAEAFGPNRQPFQRLHSRSSGSGQPVPTRRTDSQP